MDGYEKIKAVGKGSFGTATLFRRVVDGELVVIKEVFLMDMTMTERKLAQNEVQVLSALSHENIIRYLGNIEKEGSLLIIMEYANGGNLAQLINRRKEKNESFGEPTILDMFSQICSGISYMHSNKILHRDMKSANVFLSKNGTIKIGDFGISKMMDTRSQAQTVVGTPYYLSPEMCEGKDYNEKSDIWAMGCILYELATFKKPFEAVSLPMLVQKITTCNFAPIPNYYSEGLAHLLKIILQREINKRPSAEDIHSVIIPTIMLTLHTESGDRRRFSFSTLFNRSIPKERSVLYELHGFSRNADMFPVDLPHKKISDFHNSVTHYIVVTTDNKVYTWGEDIFGQLGHGRPDSLKIHPIRVDYFRGKNISRCSAGDGFSAFIDEHGAVYTCGDGKFGCLGHGDWNNIVRPKKIEALAHISILEINCGTKHVLALGANGIVYAWGSSQEGQLGLGHTQYCCKPMPIKLSNEYNIQRVYAGYNSSALITTNGKLLVCGSNKYNKLGFGSVSYLKTFLILSVINERIREIAMGVTHTAIMTENGSVYCFGNNEDGQCGNSKIVDGLFYYKMENLGVVEKVCVGPAYTVATTDENVLYFWGTHYETIDGNSFKDANSTANSHLNLLPMSQPKEMESRFTTHMKYALPPEPQPESVIPIRVPKPTPILALYSSTDCINRGNIVWLAGLIANEHSLSVLVHTTVPPPIKEISEDEEHGIDSHSRVIGPNWLAARLARSEFSLPNTPQF